MPSMSVTELTAPPVDSLPLEMVERKGLGHPDTICDALAEEASRRLSRYYLEHCGLILHHNLDKALLRGGSSQAAFGGGEVTAPIEIFLAGRATSEYQGRRLPIEELVIDSCMSWLETNLHALDVEHQVRIHPLIRPGSAELVELYLRQAESGVTLANDTSCGVGFAPLDDLEQVVLGVEQGLNSADVRRDHPVFGEDIKVMGVREGERIRLTVACAFIDRHVRDLDEYVARKRELAELATGLARGISSRTVSTEVNTADDLAAGSIYLTVTGTSAEAGDDGEVGRGNRSNGLITPYRPMNLEAAAGKNPVTHVGKLYNLAAGRIAREIVASLPEVEEVYCFLVSRIGHPVLEPQAVDLQLRLRGGRGLDSLRPQVSDIFADCMQRIPDLARELQDGSIRVF